MFQSVADNYAGGIVITDAQQRIVYANPSILRMSGYSPTELIGKTPAIFKSGKTPDEVYRDLWETIALGGVWRGEFINRRKDGSEFLENKTISAIRDSQGQIQFYYAIGEDFVQRAQYQQRIANLMAFDQLTGLPNRDAFVRSLVRALDVAQAQATEVAVLHVDLDNFFGVNETAGTGGADQVLVEITVRAKTILRQGDELARLGNDKFGILLGLQGSGRDTHLNEVAERVQEAIRQPVWHEGNEFLLTASIGVACSPVDGENASELLGHAINATEQAKNRGGDCICRFDTTTAGQVASRREVLNELRRAIERNELVLHYQPQVSLSAGGIVGLEALVRWQHPQRGLVMPGGFIPHAEQSSVIVDLGEWVLREACRQLRAWLDAGLPPLKIAVNLAARHFVMPGLIPFVSNLIAQFQLDARCLEIEITEGAMMHDVQAAIRNTGLLKQVGVRISLDDFGTGYSSLAYMSRFPIDVVKIDQSFVHDITTNPVNAAIAQATIAMSHKLGKRVLAEGVETEDQMRYLRRADCDEMQGHFFSRALAAEEVATLLRAGATMDLLLGGQEKEARSTVLFVDDEVNILSSIKRTLRREGYDILTASSADEGFSLLAKYPIQVVVSDQRMPEMNGTEFLARVKSLYPETVRIVLSGYSEITTVTDAINKGAVYRFMLKPWEEEALKEEIAGALRHWRELYAQKKASQE